MAGEPDIVPRAELAGIIARDAALRQSLLGRAMSHTHNPHEAEDLFQSTLETALDPDHAAWDRNKYLTAAIFLGSVMNGLARNRLRSSYMARREDLDEQNPPQVSAPKDDPEGKLMMAGTERKREDMVASVRAGMAGKVVPLAVLDWTEKGVKGNIALAEKIGCTVKEVVAAKQMLRERAALIAAERASGPGVA